LNISEELQIDFFLTFDWTKREEESLLIIYIALKVVK